MTQAVIKAFKKRTNNLQDIHPALRCRYWNYFNSLKHSNNVNLKPLFNHCIFLGIKPSSMLRDIIEIYNADKRISKGIQPKAPKGKA